VLAQTFTDLECIIVDDGSTDNTRQIAEHLMSLDPRVKYYFKENGGLPSARNFGVQQAKGEWLQCLDADDWIHEDKTRFQLEHLPQFEHQDIVFYSDYQRVLIDANENIVDQQNNIIGSLTTDELINRLLIPDFLANSPHPALQQAMLMKKSLLSKTKFPENLKALGDRYFGVDILMTGANFIYTPMIGAYYTKHKANRTNNWNYMKNYYTLFYELISQEYPSLNKFCSQGLEYLINEAIRKKEKPEFDMLLKVITPPVHVLNKKIKINDKHLLKIFYDLRSITPSFLLYEECRGPRSKKIFFFLSSVLKPVKSPAL